MKAAAIPQVSIGYAGMTVPAMGIGSMGLGGRFSADTSRDQEAVSILRLAFDLGLTLVDTAEVYAAGHSEELVGQALNGHRDAIYVATKVSPENLRRSDLISSAHASLKRLGIERINLYQVHWPNPAIPIEETMDALASLARAGDIQHVGVSNFSLKQLKAARAALGEPGIAAIQMEYNLFDRSIEVDLLPYCRQHGIALLAYSPLDQGHICGGPIRVRPLEALARRNGCSAAQLALSWLTKQPGVVVIPKAATESHLRANAAAATLQITAEDIQEIDELTAFAPLEVPVERIRAVPDDAGDRKVYRTLDEAQDNIYHMTPSPMDLAEDMLAGEFLKTLQVRPIKDPGGRYDYELIGGRIRYWGWVLAFGSQRPIPVLVRE